MQKIMATLVSLIAIPIVLLNLLGGIVGGIALIIGGDWPPLILGILFIFFGTFLISILLLPTLLISAIAMYFLKKRSRVGFGIATFASQSYIYALVFGIFYSVFGTMLQFENEASRLVLLIWSFAVATTPWTYLASKEQDNESTQVSLFIAQACLLVISLMLLFSDATLDESFDFIRTLIIIPILITTWYAVRVLHNSGDTLLTDSLWEGKTKHTQDELFVLVACLVSLASSDNDLDDKELNKIRQIFKELTKERVSKKFLLKVQTYMSDDAQSFEDLLLEYSEKISQEIKLLIIKGCVEVAKVNGKIEKEEISSIKSIGNSLEVSKDEITKIIKDEA